MEGEAVAVGRGELTQAEVVALLNGPSALPARLTAPAAGLFLERVSGPALQLLACGSGGAFDVW